MLSDGKFSDLLTQVGISTNDFPRLASLKIKNSDFSYLNEVTLKTDSLKKFKEACQKWEKDKKIEFFDLRIDEDMIVLYPNGQKFVIFDC